MIISTHFLVFVEFRGGIFTVRQ
ncbi:Protein of unknown function [Bacillus wiedmannii]|uniref:Uncharacterized protein n=1 Tax=Bacillus wiedmannii TaxID=1890302 RepID=A0A1C4A4F2_9BACI|nr:Protein of unknown function [Bacillus wiedmannii]